MVRGFGESGQSRILLSASAVDRQRATRQTEFFRFVSAEVWTDGLPTLPLVTAAKEMITACINCIGIVGREGNRKCPGEAVLQILGSKAR